MTPVPLILFLWGIVLASGVLPNNILGWRVPPTAAWRRVRLTIAIAAIVSGGFWLALDLTLPLILPRAHMGAKLADVAGWASVIAAVATSAWLIASRPPTHTFDAN